MNQVIEALSGDSARAWAIALAVLLGVRALLGAVWRGGQTRLAAVVARTRTRVDDILLGVVSKTQGVFFWAVSLHLALVASDLPPRVEAVARVFVIGTVLLQVGLWGTGLIEALAVRYVDRRVSGADVEGEEAAPDPDVGSRTTTASAVSFVLRGTLWVALILLLLDNLGVNITALLTGLGVGGVAVALALQNILGDLFASVSIAVDKPFVVGDFIIIDDYMGTVDRIGLKTTRVRSLSGELLIFSNADLLRARIRNYKHMAERRVVFSFGVTYDTPLGKVEAIPGVVRQAVEAREGLRFDRAHFKSFGASSLDFEVVYFVLTGDYNTYMDHQQAINLAIMRALAAAGVAFAFPSQTLYWASPGAPGDAAAEPS